MAVASERTLRPRPAALVCKNAEPSSQENDSRAVSPAPPLITGIKGILPGSKLPAISSPDLRLLRQKQAKVCKEAQASTDLPPCVQNGLRSTFIFAQYEAGTAVCIDPSGWILTCAHCFGDDEEEIRSNMPGRRWLISYTGTAVLTECRAWDIQRDLALLKVIAAESDVELANGIIPFAHVALAQNKQMARTPVMCIGQPGRDDLESSTARKTTYNLFEVSYGRLKGLIPNVDPQDNSEIGTLKHDAWTYWGHSGAPLLREDEGTLVGLHSSWDDQTAMRHAVPLVAIDVFLKERLPSAKGTAQTV